MISASFGKHIISVVLSVMIAVTFMPAFSQNAYAATAKPGKVTIKTAAVDGNTVTLKWSKAKKATKYQVYKASGTTWKYWKKVKKSQKKKYKNTAKYKLKKSGKKYKVYKKATKYVKVGTTKALSFKFRGDYATAYKFTVRAYNGKKAGAYSAAKSVRTDAEPSAQVDSEEQTSPVAPTITVPGKVSNANAEVSNFEDKFKITITWSASSGATGYEIYMSTVGKLRPSAYQKIKSDCTKCSYAIATSETNTTYKFKIVAKNSAGEGEGAEVSVTTPEKLPAINAGEYSSNGTTAWNQYLNKMLGYYKAELSKRGVSISSTNKADEFQKLQAIIQVMHDYVGYSEMTTGDYSNFPTGRENWFYNNSSAAIIGTDESGKYYNGKDYIPTIEFYADCEKQALTEKYLAEQAGLDVYTLGQVGTSHKYAMICANHVWYNADPGAYMAPGTKGLNNPGWKDPSAFKEYQYNMQYKLSDGSTFPINQKFKINNVFYGTAKSVTSSGGLSFDVYPGLGINPDYATYSSSDESILSFDESAGTCTLHKTGEVYVTITYENRVNGSDVPPITTTVRILVEE